MRQGWSSELSPILSSGVGQDTALHQRISINLRIVCIYRCIYGHHLRKSELFIPQTSETRHNPLSPADASRSRLGPVFSRHCSHFCAPITLSTCVLREYTVAFRACFVQERFNYIPALRIQASVPAAKTKQKLPGAECSTLVVMQHAFCKVSCNYSY